MQANRYFIDVIRGFMAETEIRRVSSPMWP